MVGTAEWSVGDRILDLYEVEGVIGQGGMGVVHRVRHLGWGMALAVKSPRPDLFRSSARRDAFVREVETWMSLGMHPNVCICHYVRTIDGLPRVFAEYAEAGSLRDWIDDRRLYAGTREEVLARILDVAIQTAWGLDHAHKQGLVHQDVKPANILLDADGTAKVADFGLARGRAAASGFQEDTSGDTTVLVTVGGLTPKYASPEQTARRQVGRRSDVWSFAVTVLEMFAGKVTWAVGPAAGAALNYYRAGNAKVPIPASVADILARCLLDDPAQRPKTIATVAKELREAYRRETGWLYVRPLPSEGDLRAAELNNLALSLLDLDRTAEAKAALAKARATDPRHLETIYNAGLLRWRAAELTDDALLAEVEAALPKDEVTGCHLLAQVHLERGDTASALKILEQASMASPEDPQVRQAFHRAKAEQEAHTWDVRIELEGTVHNPSSLGLSTDGTIGICRDEGSAAWVWDIPKGQCLRTLGETSPATDVALCGDGRLAMTVHQAPNRSAGLEARVWDVTTGERLYVFDTNVASGGIALNADGHVALVADTDIAPILRVWDLQAGHCTGGLEFPRNPQVQGRREIRSTTVSADGQVAVCGLQSGEIFVWHVPSGRLRGSFGNGEYLDQLAVSADGRIAIWTGFGKTIQVWNVATRRRLSVLSGHTDDIGSLAISGDGQRAVSSGHDGLRIWDLATGRCLRTLAHRSVPVAMSADGGVIFYAAKQTTAAIWRTRQPSPSPFLPSRPRRTIDAAQHGPQFDALLEEGLRSIELGLFPAALDALSQAREVPGYEREPRIMEAWHTLARNVERVGITASWQSAVLKGHPEVKLHTVSTDARIALSGGDLDEPIARIWDVETGQCLHTFSTDGWPVITPWAKVHLTPDACLVVMPDSYGGLRIWDLAMSESPQLLIRGHDRIEEFELSPDGLLLAGRCNNGPLTIWRLRTGQVLCSFPEEKSGPFSFTAHGHLLSYGPDNILRLRDPNTSKRLRQFKGHTHTVHSIAASTQAHTALSASHDRTIRAWNLDKGRCLRTLNDGARFLDQVAVTADGHTAVSDGINGTMRIWDIRTGRCLHTFGRNLDPTVNLNTKVWISRDGHRVFHAKMSEAVQCWEIDWTLRAPENPAPQTKIKRLLQRGP